MNSTCVRESIPVLRDNYVHVVSVDSRDPAAIAVVDPGQAAPVWARLRERGWSLREIWITHHHLDHVGGVQELRDLSGARVVGAAADAHRLPPLDVALSEGQEHRCGEVVARVLEVPGHTRGHVAFHLAQSLDLFCGDTLFLGGCGRLFEGTPQEMWDSLRKLNALDARTRVWCGHEYTLSNLEFAHARAPENLPIAERLAEVRELRARGVATLPGTLAQERLTNLFLRANAPAELAVLRAAKDSW